MYHHVKELVEDGEVRIEWILNSSILADGLTKALPTVLFKKHHEEWGLVP